MRNIVSNSLYKFTFTLLLSNFFTAFYLDRAANVLNFLFSSLFASTQQVPKVVSSPPLRPHHSTAMAKRYGCRHQRPVESMSLKNVPIADEHSPATIHSNDTSRTNTNSPIRSTSVSSVIDVIERKTRWQRTRAYSIAARAACLSDYWKHRRLRMFSVRTYRHIRDSICSISPPSWVNRHRAFHNKRNAINYCNYKCSIYWIHPRKGKRKRKTRETILFLVNFKCVNLNI
jgi:hypothetical protein